MARIVWTMGRVDVGMRGLCGVLAHRIRRIRGLVGIGGLFG
jgi:hypothetical protein